MSDQPTKSPETTEPVEAQEPPQKAPEVTQKADIPACPEGEHALQTAWSFWFDKKVKSHGHHHQTDAEKQNYMQNLKHLCCFNSVEQFWSHYAYITRPSQLPRESNLHLFREDYLPMWESFPNGGCWIIKVWKHSNAIDRVWETLLLAAIGELFEEPNMVGVVISLRQRQDIISVWDRDAESEDVRFAIGEKLKQLLHLSPNTVLEYKKHCNAIRDNSSYRNAKLYVAGDA